MAGTFWHLSLAHRALPVLGTDWSKQDRRSIEPAFYAGSIAPDLGFFPGGPRPYSQRVHHEATGDHVRTLYGKAADAGERAFAAGWALHLYTDVAVHPWVNRVADGVISSQTDRYSRRRDLWHQRIENGIDCHFLEQRELQFLWSVDLDWQGDRDGAALLAAVGSRYYGVTAEEAGLRHGLGVQRKWVARLPRIFLLTGHTRPGCFRSQVVFGRLMQPAIRAVVGDWIGRMTGSDNVGAVAKPLQLDLATLPRITETGSAVLRAFEQGLRDEFSSLPNLDLDTGEAVTGGR